MEEQLIRLNLGCGTDIKVGYINLDISPLPGVDIIHNIESLPLPFGDNYFDEILCNDILEHVDYIPILKDLNRILKKSGVLKVRVPHFSCSSNFIDPTHRRMFSYRTFDFFLNSPQNQRPYYFDFSFTRVVKIELTFGRKIPYNYLIKPIVNLHPFMLQVYEDTFLSRLFPCVNILIEIEK